MYGCNCYSSGESFYSECVMQNVYNSMLDFFQLVADVPGYEEVESFSSLPADDEEGQRFEEVEEEKS